MQEELSIDDENNEDDQTDNGEPVSKKRKRSGENHSHCHCPLYQVSESLLDFMSAGQPYHRFQADQVKKRDNAVVERCLMVQKAKQDEMAYKRDMKKEMDRFKHYVKLLKKGEVPNQVQQAKDIGKDNGDKMSRKEEIAKKRRETRESLPILFN